MKHKSNQLWMKIGGLITFVHGLWLAFLNLALVLKSIEDYPKSERALEPSDIAFFAVSGAVILLSLFAGLMLILGNRKYLIPALLPNLAILLFILYESVIFPVINHYFTLDGILGVLIFCMLPALALIFLIMSYRLTLRRGAGVVEQAALEKR